VSLKEMTAKQSFDSLTTSPPTWYDKYSRCLVCPTDFGNNSPMSHVPLIRYKFFPGLALLAGLAVFINGQSSPERSPPLPPKSIYADEQEVPTPPQLKKKITVEGEGPPPVTVPKGAFYVRIEDLFRAASEVKHPAIRDLLTRYAVAFDRIIDVENRPIRVTPIPINWPIEKFPQRFGLFVLTTENAPQLLSGMDLARVKQIDHFEKLILAEVEQLADVAALGRRTPYNDADPTERLAAAERLLAAGLWFHDGARDQNKRRGQGWEPIRAALSDQLAKVRLARIKLAADRQDWATVRTLGTRMETLYPNNPNILMDVFSAQLREAEAVINTSEQPSELERARDVLVKFESKFPGQTNDAVERVRAALKQKADRLYTRAAAAVKTNSPDARNLVRTLELIAPEYEGLRELQGQMKYGYTILYVGVNPLPERMSPATARFDSEKMAVELMFEGLLETLPDETHGVLYRPALAAAMPTPGALVRDVPLTRPVVWSGAQAKDLGTFDATDVAGTLKLLRQTRHTWAAYGIDWLDDQTRVEDLGRVRLAFQSGHPYPLSLLSFKLLPARWLAARNKQPDDTEFALRPFGTGPFRLQSNSNLDGRGPREVVFFSNPNYGRRPGRLGQPYIKEIRFVDTSRFTTPEAKIAEFKAEKLHILTDVPTNELAKYTHASAGLTGRVQAVTAATNRRIHILAVNHRKPLLQSQALRRGIARAIDRETILNEVYRATYTEFHKELTGPFPPNSWATPKPLGGQPLNLYDPNVAQGLLAEHSRRHGSSTLLLYFPAEDSRAKQACERIKKQVEAVGTGEAGKVTISLEPLTTLDLYRRVHEEGNFDLAYVPFDYPDELYPLGLASFLDPTATTRGGRNYMGALVKQNNPSREDEVLGRLLAEARTHADPAKLAQKSHEIFGNFNLAMPFIPLWQLDRHMVISTAVKLSFDDGLTPAQARYLPPTTLFAGVARWRIE
jgi:peptide/nickel transport system substrate-binding protein